MTIPHRHSAPHPTLADSDAILVAWAQQQPRAFIALYDRYFAAVFGYCQSHLGDPDTAEDATSQIFLKALSALPAYRETGRFRSWLFAIAHNVVLDVIRGQRYTAPLETVVAMRDPSLLPEERAIATLDVAWLDAAIARLPDSDRHVLELRRAGLNGREIAAVLGISHEAAKKRQLRAIDQIRAEAAVLAEKEVLRGA